MAKINFFAFGGQDERGKNCFVLEINNDVFIFNVGSLTPTTAVLGVKKIIPDFSWIQENQARIKGIFIGNPVTENIGSLEFLFHTVGFFPIYTSTIGAVVIKTKIHENKLNIPHDELEIHELKPLETVKIGHHNITPFKVSSSIPSSFGFALHTDDGYIVYVDDFIVLNDKNIAFENQLNQIIPQVANKTLLLITGVGLVGRNTGFTTPKHKSLEQLNRIIASAKGRVFAACYDSNAYSVMTLAQIARMQNRPFVIYSHSFVHLFNAIVRQKLFNNTHLNTISIEEINNSTNAIVVLTAPPDKLYAKLFKIGTNEDERVRYRKTDSFIFMIPRIAGYEELEAQILDDVARNEVSYYNLGREILSINASDEDMKFLVTSLKPKYIIPTSGLYRDFINFTMVMKQAGVEQSQVLIPFNGEVLAINHKQIDNKKRELKLNPKCVDSAGLQEIGASIMFERDQMSEAGVVTIIIYYDSKKSEFLNEITYSFLGVSLDSNNQVKLKTKMEELIRKQINDIKDFTTIKRRLGKDTSKELKVSIKRAVMNLFTKMTAKAPLILSTIISI
ncbi:RNase J family beta-CASP ribonuclease [Mycoplasmoides pneumoniae]|uniref:Uncharacterized protein MG423 homolog n=4 Tax=Mycoplasmoides pneumoniae TaxID=2104 RepID=Y621_MYCPN|nr:RNase J family beta-CASP ribonuclease [Mycoplasmoides pneumoniae]P75174.1 RecName: Full=Uncharacterized protein MG423 homolog [Mycoplasmoides pneumoniae M129]AAB95869.1 metallo hydrolase-like protein [Mycoplasmoides pneumoniae M129]ADK86721.1 conserved hypothetical protein [Mycoplasmoides pneumoniae FH]AGC04493.1 hypothetical protein C985_0625 [Mycoplasmoides pneumoniae M129-B7]ALA30489.1 hypothetical protein C897_03515 [Mycoplasmoides pneumoniae PI 1428]ALA30782.1 hypothetical protein B43